ncbi:MAG: Response receiver histidine kinase [Deltaproteobacteria bacterium]|nr:Response receiver histidine kinase [Deltaproteobacteria bacterium]
MIIDDEFGVRESLKMIFAKTYQIIEADSAEIAIPKFEQALPNVVLLDVMMPKTDGFELLQRIKDIHPGCAVIMLTGVNSQQLADKAKNSGAFDFIGKPFDIVELRQKVARAFAQVAQNFPSSLQER